MRRRLLTTVCLTFALHAAPGIYDDPAIQRLNPREVARARHEVSFDEVARVMGGPFSRQPVISVKAHPEIVWVRPDMALQMVANPFSFATGDTPTQIPWRRVERSLERGYLPIVVSAWRDDAVVYRQTAFATLLDARGVQTGHEKQIVMVKMDVVNTRRARVAQGHAVGVRPRNRARPRRPDSQGRPLRTVRSGRATAFRERRAD